MLSKRTIIGLVVGSVIIGIGAYSLVSDIGFQTVKVDETFEVGESTSYQINSARDGAQAMKITGEKFDLALQSPGDLQIPKRSFQEEKYMEWIHHQDGITYITVQNTGSTDLRITATFEVTTNPILFTYHLIVITSGVVIIGFSIGFTLRKPRGF